MPLPMQLDVSNTPLPIPDALTEILEKEIQHAYQQAPPLPPEDPLFAITLVFRDPGYDVLLGGFHPVEIRVGRVEGDTYRLGYLTDFSYVGSGDQIELMKEIDFEFSVELCAMRYLPPIALCRVGEFFERYLTNFISYYRNGVYDVEVIWEN
ncbi:DUF2787 domain-containing protein [Halomonas sediminis]